MTACHSLLFDEIAILTAFTPLITPLSDRATNAPPIATGKNGVKM